MAADPDVANQVQWDRHFAIGSLAEASVHELKDYGVVFDFAAHADVLGLAASHQASIHSFVDLFQSISVLQLLTGITCRYLLRNACMCPAAAQLKLHKLFKMFQVVQIFQIFRIFQIFQIFQIFRIFQTVQIAQLIGSCLPTELHRPLTCRSSAQPRQVCL